VVAGSGDPMRGGTLAEPVKHVHLRSLP
jgi:hypothetical protein